MLRKQIENVLLKDLTSVALGYDESCDRVDDIKIKCIKGQYIHQDPLNSSVAKINCRSFCTQGFKARSDLYR